MTKDFASKSVAFAKVDVDEGGTLAKRESVASMPTFKLYQKGKCVETVTGYHEANIRHMLERYGAKRKGEEGKKVWPHCRAARWMCIPPRLKESGLP